jgi:protein TonB
MEPNQILRADVLDIVFEGRNKAYGAYELRRTYNRRLKRSVGLMAGVVLVLFTTGLVLGRDRGKVKPPPRVDDVTLDAYKEKVPDPPPPPPPPKPIEQHVAMRVFTPPLIVKDPPEDQKPPEQTTLDSVRIGTVNVQGGVDDGVAPPAGPVGDAGKGVVEAPKTEDDAPFIKVEKESEFPGGMAAWIRFLNKNLRVPDDAVNNEIEGRVLVQFIVDKDGNVSDVKAVEGPEQGGLREEAVRVIKKSGKWVPAMQNGRYVKSYKQQPITFQIVRDN